MSAEGLESLFSLMRLRSWAGEVVAAHTSDSQRVREASDFATRTRPILS